MVSLHGAVKTHISSRHHYLRAWASVCRGEKLWVPSDNESQKNNAFVTKNFPSLARIQIFYLEREDGGDVLTPEAFDKALSIHNRVVSLQWNNTKSGGEGREVDYLPEAQGFPDLCFSNEGSKGADDVLDCSMMNPLSIFSYNSSSWATSEMLLSILGNPTTWNSSLTGPGFILDDALGSINRDANGGVSGAKVLALSYLLAGNKTLVQEQKDDPAAEGWEEAYLDLMEVCHAPIATSRSITVLKTLCIVQKHAMPQAVFP